MESFLETTIQCSTIYHGSSYSCTRIAVNQGQSVNWASNNLTLIITFLFWLCYALTPKGIWTNHLEFIFNFNIIFNVTLIEHFTSLTSQVLPCLTLVEVEAKLFSRILPKVLLKIFIMEKICYQFLPLSLYMGTRKQEFTCRLWQPNYSFRQQGNGFLLANLHAGLPYFYRLGFWAFSDGIIRL